MSMRTKAALIVALSLVTISLAVSAPVMADEEDISYEVMPGHIEAHAGNTTVLISTAVPAASVRAGTLENYTGDGLVLRSFLGYNHTLGGAFSPELVQFRARTNSTSWTVAGPQLRETVEGQALEVKLTAVLSIMAAKGGPGGMGPGQGGPPSVIPDWAEVTVTFTLSSKNYSAFYQGVPASPAYPINGSSELKADVSVTVLKPLPVDSLALDFGVMKMDDAFFGASTSAGPYMFRGYQMSGVSSSNPYVNETLGTTEIANQFSYRSGFKQMFEFVNATGTPDGFFSWARQARISNVAGTELSNVSAYYRTDGESLVVYLSTPLTADTITIDHDPSVGVFGVVQVVPFLPSGGLVSTSLLSFAIGAVVGVGAAGGVGAYVLARATREDSSDPVDLERNRYYRGPR